MNRDSFGIGAFCKPVFSIFADAWQNQINYKITECSLEGADMGNQPNG